MEKLDLFFDTGRFAVEFGPAILEPNAATMDAPADPAPRLDPSGTIIPLLDELLSYSIRLRDLYKTARRQSFDGEVQQLGLLLDAHYQEQLRVVDVLIDRLRMLGGTAHIFAGDFLQRTQSAGGFRGRQARSRLLRELLDEHEQILSAARQAGSGDGRGLWGRDFAVGQVVLANEQQSHAIGELLMGRGQDPRVATPTALISD